MLNYGQRKHLWLAATLSNCLLKGTTTAPLCIELSKDSWCKWVTQPARAQVLIVYFLFLLYIISLKSAHPFVHSIGGKSIWGRPFKDEAHGRIKFNHRGQVAMANENAPNTNQSQFFITLDACEWLDRKHTIFGKFQFLFSSMYVPLVDILALL